MMLDDRFFDKFGVEFSPNEIIFAEYEPGNEFYLIHSGKVRIVKIINNREKNLDILTAGDFFGEMAILEAEPRSASAIAIDKVRMLKFHRDNFDTLLEGNPQLAYRLLVIFSKRIYDAKRRLMILLLNDPVIKAMDVMCMLWEQNPQTDVLNRVTLGITATDISNWGGMPIDDTEKALTHLSNLGKIETYSNKIVVKNILDFQRLIKSRRNQMIDTH